MAAMAISMSQRRLATEDGCKNSGPNSRRHYLGHDDETHGVYMPPFKLSRMMKQVDDKRSVEYQRLTWDALRKSINGLANKLNVTNIKYIIPEIFTENLIRGRGLFCQSCMKSQTASPWFTNVLAALVAVVNTKFPEVGQLLLGRLVLQFQRAFDLKDKPQLQFQ
ncbi:pre-mRNA-splicing factor cwc22-like [Pyrus x bretschneideri]|uniref:pre-mRNA-splicing factor cwc22-like n=1 Tax=Pyrus x bretschneideri TaxID=225117 RepID=UPI00202FA4F0|nr:pre-mRNA-splicing factor cwc22-like [Pyrus x bretschneideri]